MVKNKMRLCPLFLFLFWFFHIVVFIYSKKNKLSKKLPNWFYRSWRIEKVKKSALFSFRIFFPIYSISSFLFMLLSRVHLSDMRGTKFVHSAELFWFIYYIVSAQMKFIISSKLGNINEVFFSLFLIRIRIQLFSFI